ncbi:MAG: hypothetical protein LBR10_07955 [Prevotellaceae bacterium]|jgi:hypothetical protein|nr:hypothetical protein [Prevotellaceae bacterium]
MNKLAIKNCFKICGVIFSFAPLFIIIAQTIESKYSEFELQTVADIIQLFFICVATGNGFGFLILVLAVVSEFYHSKSIIGFYNSIPEKTKETFELAIYIRNQNKRYNFTQLDILSSNPESPVAIERQGKNIFVTVISDLKNVHYQKRSLEITKKYKSRNIFLSRLGLRQEIKNKIWKKMSSSDIEDLINELRTISKDENL